MIDKGKIKNFINDAVAQNQELFITELKFLSDNKIFVEVDGDHGIPLKECIRISREVEHNLDREVEDFSLQGTSPDVSNPLKNKRQYKKNINRILKIRLQDNSIIEGALIKVTEDEIELEWKARERKPIGKGKITVVKNATVSYTNILEAKVKIIF
jgi:ribosome maturation factor RimP